MPLNIREHIQLVINQILNEKATMGGASPTGDDAQRLSLAAIASGQGQPPDGITKEWEAYMNFLLTATGTAADPDELRRLLPSDGTTDAPRQKERAYLVANGMCGSTTTDTLLDGDTTNFLDQ